ncbi:MAG: 30S ribosomal protein S4 [Candidatus Zambryskibacteria bacterium RIFCSPHIGHO2_01_FULL_43_25]|uniref:Small ribosomal subunit protein uS4 n=1 Tax=Candidatus Zambryskibacteria bacterium RIFCSPLOWO2_01_FULL_45_21 TaxID=1802761 RepID=A0A1G2U6T0_9BACT|nr:MAG: 30S ribosomal protein S4 [Candidatus Zambryskibacteria bacterium RIFCSPHIGHO2_01_FULL_43_25]OHB00560.1 MAG: 30S ribosomal protein S4 [Candidatus Zambryskibacteria bacterium RIFCSPHIGHO2_12_FULL_44_12b]OHB04710.1 MAG: 30S ribosomal protein S4 [Candidatus Zambryskibacteria bacterium RIFCSPLOWO2_01_FULL_45_21]
MRIGPKYKIARRLGAPVFEKTQTQKFTLSQQRKDKGRKKFSRASSEFGSQLLEKQKARFTYCLTERQFSKYARQALAKKDTNAVSRMFSYLETRLDNVVCKIGFAPTRLAARQMVSHGHILVNGKRVTIPSINLVVGDVVSIRVASAGKPLFADLNSRLSEVEKPSWIKVDMKADTATIESLPKVEGVNLMFDLRSILEFYSR